MLNYEMRFYNKTTITITKCRMKRSSHWSCCVKRGALINFAIFTGKNLFWSVFIKKRLQHRCFPVKFAIWEKKIIPTGRKIYNESLRKLYKISNKTINQDLCSLSLKLKKKMFTHRLPKSSPYG